MKKVLVTGAYGYLGARLSKFLAEKSFKVSVFGKYYPDGYNDWFSLMEEVIVGDIRDEDSIKKLAKKKFDIVIHLISLDHKRSEDKPNFVSSINVMPTWNLLDKLTKTGIEKFIYFSTIQVYGRVKDMIISEDHKPKPLNAYGLTHLLSENICSYYNENTETECVNVRLSNSYGSPVFIENNCWWLVINDFCRTSFNQKKITLTSDGTSLRDFIHIKDVCSSIEALLNSDKESKKYNTYNISSGNTLTILELAEAVKHLYESRYNQEIPIVFQYEKKLESNKKSLKYVKYCIDNSRLKDMGFSPQIDLTTGLNEVFDFLERNSQGSLIY